MQEAPFEILSKFAESSVEHAAYAKTVQEYLGSGDDSLLADIPLPSISGSSMLWTVWTSLAKCEIWGEKEVLLAKVAVDHAVRHSGHAARESGLAWLVRTVPPKNAPESILVGLLKELGVDRVTTGRILINHSSSSRHWGMNNEPAATAAAPVFDSAIEEWIFEGSDAELAELLLGDAPPSNFSRAVARYRPEVIGIWWPRQRQEKIRFPGELWPEMLPYCDGYDQMCIEYARELENPRMRFKILQTLHRVRGKCREELAKDATDPAMAGDREVVEWLLAEMPDQLPGVFADAAHGGHFRKEDACHLSEPFLSSYLEAVRRWDCGGREMFVALRCAESGRLEGSALKVLLANQLQAKGWDSVFVNWASGRSADIAAALWTEVAAWIKSAPGEVPASIRTELLVLLGDKSKRLREVAVDCLVALRDATAEQEAAKWLESGKIDQKLGAVSLLAATDPKAADAFLRALRTEINDKVRQSLHGAIASLGASVEVAAVEAQEDRPAGNLDEFVASQSKGLKVPKCPWLDIAKLPPLIGTDENALSLPVVAFLIAKQATHKAIEVAPDVLPVMSHIDSERNGLFAVALVEGFLNSEQAAADRWALTLGGLLGDKRIINLLLPRIQDWCENSRHKLAEYAAQAISLLPGNEPLMVLDALSNRYRSKFKNVGRACSDAFSAAATARGITADELADMVVPDFDFDAEGVRRFAWEGGGTSAELGADFKLSWFDPETDRSWKSLPANAPDEVKEEVKAVTKLIRETVKAQTARLEMSLVRQRRWPVARWKELFENHPLLRSFASGVVWGIYDENGELLRTFRRYANGILADASGAVEELPEARSIIGMIHPLELAPELLDAWQGHFARMKVKQPFPQLARPVEIMDPLHANRREISLTTDRQLSAGTFRTRAEKRGWTRGSVVDAGGISSCYKLYPGAEIEAILPTENFWVGCDPMETIELAAAYFAKSGSVERGSYIYDEPASDDPRVLRFDQVPPVVFSETLGDLKAIIATRE